MSNMSAPRIDVVTILTVYVGLSLFLPSNLIFAPLGAAGTPATLVGIGCFFWWLATKMSPRTQIARAFQPIYIALGLLTASLVASYAAAMLRMDIPYAEISSADRSMLSLVGWLGVALVAADGISTWDRLDRLMARIVACVTGLAALGIVQFFTGLDIRSIFEYIPGLTVNAVFDAFGERFVFRRVQATFSHPIEFGVLLGVVLGVALSRAWSSASPWSARRRWGQCALITAAGLMTVSRSAMVAIGVTAIVMFLSWDRRRRWVSLAVLPFFVIAMRIMVPGLVGTVRNLFTDIEQDTSTQARVEDYAAVAGYIAERPWLGRGFRTFLPESYRFLDNQYLISMVETGLIGTVILVAVFLIGFFIARGARRRASLPAAREMGQSLAAVSLAAGISAITFDALSFPTYGGIYFLLLGCAGALWRLAPGEQRQEPELETTTSRRIPLASADHGGIRDDYASADKSIS
jgi:polysaccharide biosynthesis protein PslJ